MNNLQNTSNNNNQCPVCGVVIEEDLVKFSFGKPGTKARLYARVCQFIQKDETKKAACINTFDDVEALTPNDHYN